MDLRRFEPREVCAVEPRAFGMLFGAAPKPAPEIVDGIAVLRIQGPLTHHADSFCASYDEIEAQAREVAALSPRAVVLRIDSPGGLASGCFEASRQLSGIFSGIPIYAHVSGQACSAAYALACAADEIVVSSTGIVGSVGVIDALVDCTAADERAGVAFHLIKSGDRKADGNPHASVDAGAIAARQAIVDDFAAQFFALVAERRGVSAEEVAALEAGIFPGASAVSARLADRVEDYSDFFARISAGEQAAGATAPAEEGAANMAAEDRDDVVAKLRKLAESEDEKEAARAKKALAAMEGDEEEPKEPEGKAEDGDEEKKPEATAKATILSLSAKIAKLEADAQAKAEAEERTALIASRPDLPAETVAWLKTIPLAEVRGAIGAIPKIPGRAEGLAATSVVGATRGSSQASLGLPPDEKLALAIRMGVAQTERGVLDQGDKLILGAIVPKKEVGHG